MFTTKIKVQKYFLKNYSYDLLKHKSINKRQAVNIKMKNGEGVQRVFCMQSGPGCYQHKINFSIYKIFYISLRITTKQKPIVDPQKINA